MNRYKYTNLYDLIIDYKNNKSKYNNSEFNIYNKYVNIYFSKIEEDLNEVIYYDYSDTNQDCYSILEKDYLDNINIMCLIDYNLFERKIKYIINLPQKVIESLTDEEINTLKITKEKFEKLKAFK